MRRADREIKGFENLVSIIADCDVVRLAFSADPVPYILPLNFGFKTENGILTLYFHGAKEGRKFDFIHKLPEAAFEADTGHELYWPESSSCTMLYRSVIGRGRIAMVPDGPEKDEALELLMKHYRPETKVTADTYAPPAVKAMTAVFKLTVTEMTGKERKGPKSSS